MRASARSPPPWCRGCSRTSGAARRKRRRARRVPPLLRRRNARRMRGACTRTKLGYDRRMELLAHTRIVMWEGASLWVVDATPVTSAEPRRTDFHAHHAIQVTIGLGGWFKLATEETSVA